MGLVKPLHIALSTLAVTAAISVHGAVAQDGKAVCSAEKKAEMLAPATARDRRFVLDCSMNLSPSDVVEKEVSIGGSAASGLTLDCHGARIGAPERGGLTRPAFRLVVQSLRTSTEGVMDAPTDVTIRNCVIDGTLRIYGMDGEMARVSALKPGHTARAQAAAPKRIHLDRMRFIGSVDRFKLLINVGSTDVSVTNSVFQGDVVGTTVYVGDEVVSTRIEHNRFEGVASRREQIALDGAAKSVIRANHFSDTADGGVFIYRNCGERGRIRVQEPRGNRIEDNVFEGGRRPPSAKPVVWIGSRNLRRLERPEQCMLDDGLGFGSSLPEGVHLSEQDMARETTVKGNVFVGIAAERSIRNDDQDNVVIDNSVRSAP